MRRKEWYEINGNDNVYARRQGSLPEELNLYRKGWTKIRKELYKRTLIQQDERRASRY